MTSYAADTLPPPGAAPRTARRTSAQPASPYATPGANLSAYGPGNDLRGTAITPGTSPRLARASSVADRTANSAANFSLSPFQSVGPYQSQNSMDGVGRLSTAPIAATDFSAARGALTPGLQRASSLYGDAQSAVNGVGGVSYDGGLAESSYGQASGLASGALQYGDDTGEARKLALQRVSSLGAVDRQKLAGETLSLLEDQSRPGFEVAQRQIGQKAAALGRIGSGITTTELGDLAQNRERDITQARRQLSTEAAALKLQDELDVSDRTSGLFRDFDASDMGHNAQRLDQAGAIRGIGDSRANNAQNASSAQAQNAGIGLQRASLLRGLGNDAEDSAFRTAGLESDWARTGRSDAVDNEDRRLGVDRDNIGLDVDRVNFNEDRDRYGYTSRVNERDTARGDEYDQYGVRRSQANDAGTRESGIRDYERSNREELRGERTFQNGMARDAQNDRIDMAKFGEWLRSQGIGNATSLAGTGYGGSPSGAFGQAAGAAQGEADGMFGDIGDLASLLPYLTKKGGGLPKASQTFSGGGTYA